MRYLVQALLSLAALVAAPVFLPAPDELWQQVAAGVVALILVVLACRGAIGFARSRRPKTYHDSIMPPKK